MQPHLRHQLPDPPSDLDEKKPEGIQLHSAHSAGDEFPPQSVHEPVGRGMQQEPKLVGHESMATEAVGFYVKLEVLDPVLALPTARVKRVKLLRMVAPGGNDEAGIGPLLHRLGLVCDPTPMLPACGPVQTFTKELHLLTFLLVALLCLTQQTCGHLFETRVGYEPHRVGDALLFAVVVQSRHGEAGIRPYLYCHPGPSFSQALHNAL